MGLHPETQANGPLQEFGKCFRYFAPRRVDLFSVESAKCR